MKVNLKYPLGIQTFSEIRQENYHYVDKTTLIHQLIDSGKVYFFARPRRFGKSLLISTIEAIFLGHKPLFENLAIADTDYDFTVYPVIKMEFSQDEFSTGDSLRRYIYHAVNDIAEKYKVTLSKETYSQRFAELMIKLHQQTQQRVVLLIDEYDKPILNNLSQPILPEIKQVMNAFYAVVKPLDEHLKFVFITGVSKFAKVSVFSGMNSLTDISMDQRYATLCGITEQELQSNFGAEIEQLSGLEKLDKPQVLAKIKRWYNGYYFEENATSVYNPYSLLSLFSKQKFQHYWFTTATPTFLIELIKSQQFDLSDIEDFEVDEGAFMSIEPEQMSPLPVLLQTGYLTIASFEDGWYKLNFPNYEVKYAFNRAIVEQYAHTGAGVNIGYIRNLSRALNQGDLDSFFDNLKIFFANIPFDITLKQEKYYQSLFYAIFTLLGFQLEAEVRTNKGRIDCVLQTDSVIYIIEFKLNDTKEAALQQIQDKQYAQKYQNSGKDIVLLGVEFDQHTRNIGGFLRHTDQ